MVKYTFGRFDAPHATDMKANSFSSRRCHCEEFQREEVWGVLRNRRPTVLFKNRAEGENYHWLGDVYRIVRSGIECMDAWLRVQKT